MSAICGIHLRARAPAPRLDALLAALPGRGADARAAWTDAAAGLGWRGDAPADEAAPERLPRVDRRAGLAVTASARLDDRATLCDALGVPHPERRGLSDGELLLKAYERWGRECPRRLLGDYAFAVWDAKRRTLFCARDHVGARPFYYSLTADRIVFASDVNAVLAAPGVSDDLDEAVVAAHLTAHPRPFGARTFFRAVRRLLPGHALTIEGGSERVERWWRPEDTPPAPDGDDDALAEAFLELYAGAVLDRVRGPHRAGVHLSGGLDSSSVAVLTAREMARTGRPAPLAFSWQPPPGPGPRNAAAAAEYRLIEAVARQERLQVLYRSPRVSDVVDHLRRDVTRDPETHVNEEPVRRCASERGVRVLLSGWGGDEGISFNGRGYYPQLLLDGRPGALWRDIRQHSRCPLAAVLAHAVLPLAAPGVHRALVNLRQGRWPARKPDFLRPGFARCAQGLPQPSMPAAGVRRGQLHLLRLGHLDARMDGWWAGGARHGIQYAYPLLDRRVLEFALGVSPEHFRRGRWSRWLMRHALGPVLPDEVRWHTSKSDPARFEPLFDAFAEALPVVRELLDARPAPPSRGRYVDIPRLAKHLDADRFRKARRMGPLVRTLEFLDF